MHVYVSLMDISWERLEWNLYKSMSLKPLVNNCWIKCLPCFTLSFTLINGKRGHDSIQSTSFYRVLRTRHPDGLHQKKEKKKHLHNATIMPPHMAFKPPSPYCLKRTEKPQTERERRKKEQEKSKPLPKKKPGESGREIHFVFRLNTDFITGLKHITLKAKSNIKNDRRYKYGEWAGVTEGGGAGGLSATICQSELETIRGDWKGRWLLLSSGAASKLPQMWPCI